LPENAASATPLTEPPDSGAQKPRRIVGVQFRQAAAIIYDFDAAGLPLAHGDCVIVETERGEALGWTVGEPQEREPHTEGELRRVLRLAGPTDETKRCGLLCREKEALRYCAQKARQLQLPMKVVAVEWVHSGEKATFYFSAEERIDFRTLVKDLAQHFRLRVEMRQVGPRDEAKITGALGPCGRETCCSSWMRSFGLVSIRMAKDQGLAINPSKVTGVCERLLCCLAHEQDTYRDLRRKLPRVGKQVVTPRGPGRVIDLQVLSEKVRVQLEGVDEWTVFPASEVRPVGAPAPEEPEKEADSEEGGEEIPKEIKAIAPAPKALTPLPPVATLSRPAGEGKERHQRSTRRSAPSPATRERVATSGSGVRAARPPEKAKAPPTPPVAVAAPVVAAPAPPADAEGPPAPGRHHRRRRRGRGGGNAQKPEPGPGTKES